MTATISRDDDGALVAAAEALVASVESERGYRPVSDQFWIDLHHRSPADVALSVAAADGTVEAFGLLTELPDQAMGLETVTSDHVGAERRLRQLVDAALIVARDEQAASLTWTVQGPTVAHDAVARDVGLAVHRRLHQMRRALPIGLTTTIPTRPFDPSRDVDDWVRVNGRAFAWNPEQGSWTADDVRARMQEPWFDAAGLLVHEREGRMAGFCWTKQHPPSPAGDDPAMGEIYVIAVDPEFHGFGLGRDLTVAGLDHLAAAGLPTAMLFVDADNVAAIRVYDRLGFVVHRTDTLFRIALDAGHA